MTPSLDKKNLEQSKKRYQLKKLQKLQEKQLEKLELNDKQPALDTP